MLAIYGAVEPVAMTAWGPGFIDMANGVADNMLKIAGSTVSAK